MADIQHRSIERGCQLTCAPPADAEQRASLCSMSWAMSMAFGGDCVRVQDYLPGLHLDIQARHLMEPLPPGPVPQPYPVRRSMLDWNSVEQALWNALHGTWPTDAIEVEDAEVRCVIRSGDVPHAGATYVAFTLRCLWPGVVGGIRSPACAAR